jgi:hypothetical protein
MLLPDAFMRIHGESKSEAMSPPRVRHQKSAGIVPATRACTPLAAIIILEVGKCGPVQILKLRGLEKTRHGVPHVLHLPGLFDPVKEFSRCMELLRRTDVYTITRPANEDSLDEVTSLILGCARGMDQYRETLSPKLRPDRPSISSTIR